LEGRKNRELKLVAKIDEQVLKKVSNLVFNLNTSQDIYKIKILSALYGIGPAVASTILTFFDPKNYGVFDVHVWREVFGKESKNPFTAENYVKLLSKLREIAKREGLEVRTIEKALFKKNYDEGKKQSSKINL
jgi:thermostable 8-oxoguanine DNA glycosylase